MTLSMKAQTPILGDDYATLRDFFAAHALTGILACPDTQGLPAALARVAYQYADEMLKARGTA